MKRRLVVVSNRIPTEEAPSGGLVVALDAALRREGGIWLGAASEIGRNENEDDLQPLSAQDYDKLAFRLSQSEYDNYYLGYSNSVLWPLFHRRDDLLALDRNFADAYIAVNRRVARHVQSVTSADDMIWVHDYHFLPLAHELRAIGVEERIGFFLHIPFPSLEALHALPQRDAFYDWIASFDLVGLQTRADVARCIDVFRAHPEGEILNDGRIKFRSRIFELRSFPIGIDVAQFRSASEQGKDDPTLDLGIAEKLVIGVDRLDYSKGLGNRFLAFGRYLDNRGDTKPRATLLQIAPPSREAVLAYRQTRDELESITGHINGEHAELDWTPIRYIHRPLPRERLVPLYRRANVGLVTPLIDGMNLVAKEFVAAQDPADPGVLILSRSAGAAEDMTDALLVNPYDIDEMAEAISTAVTLPLKDRISRHEALLAVVEGSDISVWTDNFLATLSRLDGAEFARFLRRLGRSADDGTDDAARDDTKSSGSATLGCTMLE